MIPDRPHEPVDHPPEPVLSPPPPGLAQRSRALLAVPILIAAALISAVVSAWLTVAFCIALVTVITRLRREEWTAVSSGFARYHEPPLARAADCTVGVVRHLRDAIADRSARHAVDALMCAGFVLLIVMPVLLVKLASHDESLGNPLELTIGIVLGDLMIELQAAPSRLLRYRGKPEQPSPLWITWVLLSFDLLVFFVLDVTRGQDSSGPVRSLLTGFVLIAVVHAVAVLTTFVAILTNGRPLR